MTCDMLAMELPYGERDRTAPVDQYASIFPYAPSSVVDQDMSTITARQRSGGVWSAPFTDKKKSIGRTTSPGDIDDTATITTQVFKAKLDQLSSFRQLSKTERQLLLLDVKTLLGGDENKSSSYDRQRSTSGGKTTDDEDGTMFSTTDEDQTQFTLDETQFTFNEDQTEFDQTQFTITNDDQETQFSSDSQSLLSLIDNVFSRKSHDERRGDSGRRRRERTASWSHGGSVDYYEDGGENCMLSMCDSFLSSLICDGKSDAVEMAARERKNDRRIGDHKRSRERTHDNDEQRREVAYREPSFVMDESVIYSDDGTNGGTVNDDSLLQEQQSSLLSGWNEATSPDKVDPSSGVTTALMSMDGNHQLVTNLKEVDNTAKMDECLRQDVVLVDDNIGVVVDEGTIKESYEDNIVDSNNHVTTARASSPTESIDDIISQTEQLSSGKISLREELDSKTSSLVSRITPKNPWKEYTDTTTGLKYYSNGVITTWDQPDDSSNIIVASPSMSAIKSQLKNEKKQLLLDSMATNNGRFKSIRVRMGIKSFFKRKK